MGWCGAYVRFRRQSRHDRLRMSAFAVAIGGKTDMPSCTAHVCYWPQSGHGPDQNVRPKLAPPQFAPGCVEREILKEKQQVVARQLQTAK